MGSLLAARLLRLPASHARVFGALQVLIGLAVMATLHLPPGLWRRLGDDSWIYVAVLLVPAVLSGASFPIAVRLWVDDPSRAGIGVGRVAAINTVGGILGSLAFGFAGLPIPNSGKSSSLLTHRPSSRDKVAEKPLPNEKV